MERHFALPIAFAAAAHGALLFGFNHPPHAPTVGPKVNTVTKEFPLPPPPEIEIIESSEPVNREAPKPEVPAKQIARSAELPSIAHDRDFTIKPQPLRAFTTDEITNVIPPDVGIAAATGPLGDVVPRHLLDKAPSTRVQPSPVYPHEGRQSGLSGEVIVEFVVDENGRVLDPQVVKSSHRMFEEPTLRAVSKWVFEPGRHHGKVVRFRMMAPVVYNLNE